MYSNCPYFDKDAFFGAVTRNFTSKSRSLAEGRRYIIFGPSFRAENSNTSKTHDRGMLTLLLLILIPSGSGQLFSQQFSSLTAATCRGGQNFLLMEPLGSAVAGDDRRRGGLSLWMTVAVDAAVGDHCSVAVDDRRSGWLLWCIPV